MPLSGLYLISDETMLASGSFLPFLEEALAAGLRIVQLRAKTMPHAALCAVGAEVRRLTRAHGATFIVNDLPEVALELDADGVHLGQDDPPPAEARRLLGPDRLIGLSTHNREQIARANREPVDYIGVGPVFATRTKANPDPTVGLELLRWANTEGTLPTVAIGGITLETLDPVLATGAASLAVIAAIGRAPNPAQATREFLHRIAVFRNADNQ
jgi:thiamine-phosphate pyrophosphorylase